MHQMLHRLEKLIDWLIAPALLILLALILLELAFPQAHVFVEWFDFAVISIFASDLAFKYNHVRSVPKFFRRYWLEIIATLPFFLVFRMIEFMGISEILEKSQSAAHGATELSKVERETGIIVKEAQRSSRMIRTFRFALRFPRFLRAVHFYEKPANLKFNKK